ncbi:MAG: hypothetical protein AAFS07_19010, partial [Pseudomonadota bacterium]
STAMATNRDTLACAPLFSQDAILARLATNSNRQDWGRLLQLDSVLQTFLNDTRFPPATKFYWHPGPTDARGAPMGIRSGSQYCSVWVDPASLGQAQTFCAGNANYIFRANEALVARAPACTVPFMAGCRVYTNPGGYFIPGGVMGSVPEDCVGGTWLLAQASDGNYQVAPTVYDTDTLQPVACGTRFTIGTADAGDKLCADASNPAYLEPHTTPGLCGTTCAMPLCTGSSGCSSSGALVSGLCSVLDAQAGDAMCANALRTVIGGSGLYDYTQTWCMRDDTNALGLDPAPTNTCFVNDVRRVMSGDAANPELYGLQYGGTAACAAIA